MKPMKGVSILQSHDLGIMTQTPHKGKGNSSYKPEVKNSGRQMNPVR